MNVRFSHSLVLLTWLVSFVLVALNAPALFDDPDVAWHMAAGDWMRLHGTIPQTDPFSFTAGNYPWLNVAWGWDVAISYMHHWLGTSGLRVMMAALFASTFAVVMHHLLQRAEASVGTIAVMMLLCMFSFWPMGLVLRPQIISFLGIAITHWLLFRVVHRGASPKQLAWLPLLTIVWVNMHGGFMALYIVLGCYGLEAIYCKQWPVFKRLFLVGAVCLFAALINPWHIGVVEAILRSYDSVVFPLIQEWQPLQLTTSIIWLLGLLLVIVVMNFSDKTLRLSDKILVLIWLVAGLLTVRYFYLFMLVLVPILAQQLQLFQVAHGNASPRYKAQQPRGARPVLLVVLLLSVISSPFWVGAFKTGSENGTVPSELFDIIERDYPDARLWNNYAMGGKIIYFSTIRPSVDGRAGTVYPEPFLEDVVAFLDMPDDWEAILQRYDISHLLVNNDSIYARAYEVGGLRPQLTLIKAAKTVSFYAYTPSADDQLKDVE